MAQTVNIEERTENFIEAYQNLKNQGILPDHKELAKIMGVKSVSTISEILGKRQNIKPENWRLFKEHFRSSEITGIIPVQKNNAATENISGGTIQERYIRLLEQNDQFFKTQYHNLLISLNTIIAQGQKSEVLLKLNLQHVGAIEALQRGLEPDVVQEQINSQIASLSPDDNTDNDGGT
jgi:hypothetical protein